MKKNKPIEEIRGKGRPRNFDVEEVLEASMKLFWRHGYEATSMAELTKATGLSATSLYASFGNKKELFDKSIELYQQRYGVDLNELGKIENPKAWMEAYLKQVAAGYTKVGKGCMVISCAINGSEDSKDVQSKLRKLRKKSEEVIKDKIKSSELAKFYASIIQGMSLQAQDGANEAELMSVVKNAMKAWPS